jgi:hypothetical protein
MACSLNDHYVLPQQVETSASEAAPAPAGKSPRDTSDVPADFCPNCSATLNNFRCKMTCPRCGFFLSCSDFY